jgi:hypothetical protein
MVDMDDSLSMDWRGERRPRERCIVGDLRLPGRITRGGADPRVLLARDRP